jgi:hypothetical protein
MINTISFLVILINTFIISIVQQLDLISSFVVSLFASIVLFPISALEFGILFILFIALKMFKKSRLFRTVRSVLINR